MPSIFPELYTYALIAPFVLRIALAIVAIKHGSRGFGGGRSFLSKITGGIMMASGALVAVGLFTQAAALAILAVLVFVKIFKSKANLENTTLSPRAVALLMTAIAASIMLLGPGAFSFDLPL